jgi:hypothetical protein
MMGTDFEDEIVEGYRDGYAADSDEPGNLGNRSEAYAIGWFNGRDDRRGRPRTSAGDIRRQVEAARAREAGA